MSARLCLMLILISFQVETNNPGPRRNGTAVGFGEVGARSFWTHDEASCDLRPALRDYSGRAGGVSWF